MTGRNRESKSCAPRTCADREARGPVWGRREPKMFLLAESSRRYSPHVGPGLTASGRPLVPKQHAIVRTSYVFITQSGIVDETTSLNCRTDGFNHCNVHKTESGAPDKSTNCPMLHVWSRSTLVLTGAAAKTAERVGNTKFMGEPFAR